MSGISRDEWLKALGEAVKPVDPDALTIKELAEMFGSGRQATYQRMRKLITEKKAIQVYKDIDTGAGRRRVPAYKLIKGKR